MKNILFAAGLALVSFTPAFAEGGGGNGLSGNPQNDMMVQAPMREMTDRRVHHRPMVNVRQDSQLSERDRLDLAHIRAN